MKPKLSEERRAEFKQKRLEEKSKLSLAFQLGYYVGEKIIDKYLPTLSVDAIHTNKNILVSSEEYRECDRLNKVWFGKCMSFKGTDEEKIKATENEWNALRAYHEMLEEKYLPQTIDCHFGQLNVTEEHMSEFKKGLVISLWDSDCSHYSCKEENVVIKVDDLGYTIITLKKE